MRLAISWYQWNIISPKEVNDISYHEIHPEKKKMIYIYIYDNKDWARHNQIGDWQLHNINEILYRHKKMTIFPMMRYIQKEQKRFIYIYIWKKRLRERQTNMRLAISWY